MPLRIRRYDTDGSGDLSASVDDDDLASFAEHIGFAPRNVASLWRRMDLDNDGALSVDEVTAGPDPDKFPQTAALFDQVKRFVMQSWATHVPMWRVLRVLGGEDYDMRDARERIRKGVVELLGQRKDELKTLVKAANRDPH